MFSCCALFSQAEDPADVEHLKALDVSGIGKKAGLCPRANSLLLCRLKPPFQRGEKKGQTITRAQTPSLPV